MSQAPGEEEIREVWSSYWGSMDTVAQWDSLSETILRTLERESRGFAGRLVMEAGCGTGRISHRVALAGARVTCLDITSEALELAAQTFASTPARFVQASILDVPRDERYDLVWNAGVLEHFTIEDQRRSISEFLSVLAPDGRVVIFTPYSRSLLYRAGKLALELLGRWKYGVEIPKASLADCMPAEAHLELEYTMAFLPLLFDAYKFLKPLRGPLRWLWSSLARRLGVERLMDWDLAASRLFGGYLLVSVIRPRDAR